MYLSDAAEINQAFAVWYLVVPGTPPLKMNVVGCLVAVSQSQSQFAEVSQQPLRPHPFVVARAPSAPYYAVESEKELSLQVSYPSVPR